MEDHHTLSTSLRRQVEEGGLFQGYAYSYPHKTAYRPLDPAPALRDLWAGEARDSLFLYAHIPFCGMRCGFCNLFTTTGSTPSLESRYLDALERQTGVVGEILVDARFSRAAIGGGTPTLLSPAGLDRLFRILGPLRRVPGTALSIEMSPETVDAEKLAFLRSQGVTRASLGVQSFIAEETKKLGRPQTRAAVEQALTLMRAAGFPAINIDLIYGVEGQTTATWETSLLAALQFTPEELYLYPLYVRPLTGLGRKGCEASDNRADLYRHGRDFLLARGYTQVSMRLFRAAGYTPPEGPVYCCQEDGMLGLGAGARSYTRHVHYSSEWAVGRESVRGILDDFIARPADSFARAGYGCRLTAEEERRRYLIKSLLRADGLDTTDYYTQFGSSPETDFPQLQELLATGAAVLRGAALCPTLLGLEWSDVIGPWLYSASMTARMETFALR